MKKKNDFQKKSKTLFFLTALRADLLKKKTNLAICGKKLLENFTKKTSTASRPIFYQKKRQKKQRKHFKKTGASRRFTQKKNTGSDIQWGCFEAK